MIRTRKYLESRGLWNDALRKEHEERAEASVKAIVDQVLNWPAPDKSEMFDSLYATIPAHLARQRDTMQTHSLGQNPEQAGLKAQPEAV